MSVPNVGQPFYTPGSIVNDAAGHSYQANAQGQLVPVQVTPMAGPGNPGQPQIGNQAPAPVYQQQPQAQQPSQQQQPQGMSPSTVLRGPGIPAELQGRTFGEALQIYGAMRQQYGNGQVQAQPAQQPQQQQAPAQQNGQQPNTPMDPRKFYENPEGNTRRIVEETIRSTLGPMLQPVMQQSAQSAASQAQAEFLRANPGAQQHLAEMQPMLARSTPEQLANPQTWDAVYNYVLGQKVRQVEANQGYNPNPQAAPQQPQNQWPERVTPMGAFFSESSSPSPSALGADPRGGASALTSAELSMARASGMTAEQYALSKADLSAGRMPGFGPQWGQGNATPGNGGWNNGR